MIACFVWLLLAHVIADFVLQSGAMVERKHEIPVFVAHILIVALTAAIALAAFGRAAWLAVVLVTLAHAAIDAIKTWMPAGRSDGYDFAALKLFAIDQCAHLASLGAVVLYLPNAYDASGWPELLSPDALALFLKAVALLAGFLLATRVGALLIERIMQGLAGPPGSSEAKSPMPGLTESVGSNTADPAHLPRAGVWIGWLERILVFVFVLLGQFGAIGFVIAAKSVLRFEYARKVERSELVIIGSLASFSWAIGCALATRALIGALS